MYLLAGMEYAGKKPGMSSLCQDICQIAFTSKLVALFIIYRKSSGRHISMLEGYNSVRPLTEEDHKLWQDILSAAALRFWVSRLYDYYMPRPASLLTPHDPAHFERILKLRRESAPEDLPWI